MALVSFLKNRFIRRRPATKIKAIALAICCLLVPAKVTAGGKATPVESLQLAKAEKPRGEKPPYRLNCEAVADAAEAGVCEQRKATNAAWGAVWATIIAGLISLLALLIAAFSWLESRRAREIAERSDKRDERAHTAEMRPWIALSIKHFDVPSAVVTETNWAYVDCLCEVTNLGKLPAAGVEVAIEGGLYPRDQDHTAALKAYAQEHLGLRRGNGQFLLPAAKLTLTLKMRFNRRIDDGKSVDKGEPAKAVIFCCVTYDLPNGKQNWQTLMIRECSLQGLDNMLDCGRSISDTEWLVSENGYSQMT